MSFQQRMFNSTFLAFYIAILCIFCVPIMTARNLENSKNELSDNDSTGPGSGNGKGNYHYNTAPASAYYSDKHNLRSFLMAPARDYQQKSHSKFLNNLDLMDLLLEYGDEDRSKRFDDYGHMRFGKRGGEEQFDDYGHMRFGRSV